MSDIDILRLRVTCDEVSLRVTRAQLAFAIAEAEVGILALDGSPERAELEDAYAEHAKAFEALAAARAARDLEAATAAAPVSP